MADCLTKAREERRQDSHKPLKSKSAGSSRVSAKCDPAWEWKRTSMRTTVTFGAPGTHRGQKFKCQETRNPVVNWGVAIHPLDSVQFFNSAHKAFQHRLHLKCTTCLPPRSTSLTTADYQIHGKRCSGSNLAFSLFDRKTHGRFQNSFLMSLIASLFGKRASASRLVTLGYEHTGTTRQLNSVTILCTRIRRE